MLLRNTGIRCALAVVMAVTLCTGCTRSGGTPPAAPTTSLAGVDSEKPRVLVAFFTDPLALGEPSSPGSKAIFVAMDTGEIIWSAEGIRGGPPYFKGQVAPDALGAAVESMCEQMHSVSIGSHFGPSAGVTVLSVQCGGGATKLISWHELFEQEPGLVATDHGIEVLGGRTREEVRKTYSKEYAAFRAAWSEIRRLADGLRPEQGQPCDAASLVPAGFEP